MLMKRPLGAAASLTLPAYADDMAVFASHV